PGTRDHRHPGARRPPAGLVADSPGRPGDRPAASGRLPHADAGRLVQRVPHRWADRPVATRSLVEPRRRDRRVGGDDGGRDTAGGAGAGERGARPMTTALRSRLAAAMRAARPEVRGRVTSAVGLRVTAEGLSARVGDLVYIG